MRNPNLLFATNSRGNTPSEAVLSLGKMLDDRNVEWGATHRDNVDLSTGHTSKPISEGFRSSGFRDKEVVAIIMFKRSNKDARPDNEHHPIMNPDWLSELCVDKMAITRILPSECIPTYLLYRSTSTPEQVREVLATAIEEHPGTEFLVIKPRSGSGSKGVRIVSATDLWLELNSGQFDPSIWGVNMVLQPYVDRVSGDKPYLDKQYLDRPAILRIIGGGVADSNDSTYIDLSSATYRVDASAQSNIDVCSPEDEAIQYLAPEGHSSLMETYPLLRVELLMALRAIEALLGSKQALKYSVEKTQHGYRQMNVAIDIIQGPNGPLILEMNSSPQRVRIGDVEFRVATQRVEANVLAAVSHRSIPTGDDIK